MIRKEGRSRTSPFWWLWAVSIGSAILFTFCHQIWSCWDLNHNTKLFHLSNFSRVFLKPSHHGLISFSPQQRRLRLRSFYCFSSDPSQQYSFWHVWLKMNRAFKSKMTKLFLLCGVDSQDSFVFSRQHKVPNICRESAHSDFKTTSLEHKMKIFSVTVSLVKPFCKRQAHRRC